MKSNSSTQLSSTSAFQREVRYPWTVKINALLKSASCEKGEKMRVLKHASGQILNFIPQSITPPKERVVLGVRLHYYVPKSTHTQVVHRQCHHGLSCCYGNRIGRSQSSSSWSGELRITASRGNSHIKSLDRGARQKFWKESIKGTKILIRGRGLNFFFPKRYQFWDWQN